MKTCCPLPSRHAQHDWGWKCRMWPHLSCSWSVLGGNRECGAQEQVAACAGDIDFLYSIFNSSLGTWQLHWCIASWKKSGWLPSPTRRHFEELRCGQKRLQPWEKQHCGQWTVSGRSVVNQIGESVASPNLSTAGPTCSLNLAEWASSETSSRECICNRGEWMFPMKAFGWFGHDPLMICGYQSPLLRRTSCARKELVHST